MAAVVAEILSIADARRRLDEMRAGIEAEYGDVEVFKARGSRYDLDPVGLAKFDRLREMEYLLGD